MDWQSCALLPTLYCQIIISYQGIVVGDGPPLWCVPEPFLLELVLKKQVEHVEYAWLCRPSETDIFVHVLVCLQRMLACM